LSQYTSFIVTISKKYNFYFLFLIHVFKGASPQHSFFAPCSTFILAARGSGHAAGPRGAISVSHRKSEGGEPHEAAAAFHRGDLDLRGEEQPKSLLAFNPQVLNL
jgi:hypothetical protein